MEGETTNIVKINLFIKVLKHTLNLNLEKIN